MNQDSAVEQPKTSIDGLTDAHLVRLEAATDSVIQDIHKNERDVAPVAGLKGISEERLRRIIKSALRHRMLLTAIDERKIKELEGKVSTQAKELLRYKNVVEDITKRLKTAKELVDRWRDKARAAEAEVMELKQKSRGLKAGLRAFMKKFMGDK